MKGRGAVGVGGPGDPVRSGSVRSGTRTPLCPPGTATARTHHLEPPTRAATSAAAARSLPPRPRVRHRARGGAARGNGGAEGAVLCALAGCGVEREGFVSRPLPPLVMAFLLAGLNAPFTEAQNQLGWKRPMRAASPTYGRTLPCQRRHGAECHSQSFPKHLQRR